MCIAHASQLSSDVGIAQSGFVTLGQQETSLTVMCARQCFRVTCTGHTICTLCWVFLIGIGTGKVNGKLFSYGDRNRNSKETETETKIVVYTSMSVSQAHVRLR